uniref:Reverse transcriptase zinc-binding domain-containing protein n=1 Tax=Chenopodium quinoa TaxID=63459 RepID=A0A803N6X6_CHEQI
MMDTAVVCDKGRKNKLFRFEAWWLSSEECEGVVKKAWAESRGKMAHSRLNDCATALIRWSAKTFRALRKKINEKETELQEAQGAVLDGLMLEKCKKLSEEINELRQMEESYWYARARANEMKDGDKNTSYFHRKACHRKIQNYIDGIYDGAGVWREDEQGIKNTDADYFVSLFSSENPTEFEEALAGVHTVVSEDMNVDHPMWNVELVREVLGEYAPIALSIPLSQHNTGDRVYWRFTNNGQFSVKSCYWMIRGVRDENREHGDCWKSVWKLKAPPKLKHFVWNALKGNMAVKARLYQKHISEDSWCQVCGDAPEMVMHSLFFYRAARSIWRMSMFENLLEEAPHESFVECWKWLLHKVVVGFFKYVVEYSTYAQRVFGATVNHGVRSNTSWQKPSVRRDG